MKELIDKSALVAEIERRYEYWREKDFNSHSIESEIRMSECQYLMLLFNNFEVKVKEVDLDFQTFAKEMETVFALPSSKTENTEEEPLNWEYAITKHFFELGLKVKGE